MLAIAACCVAIAGCGGGDDDKGSSSDTGDAKASSTAAAPTRDSVLRCLQAAGLPAERQSGLDDDPTIGIDTSSGRTVISFAKTKEEADLSASIQEQYGKVVQEGLVTTALDDGTIDDETTIRGCMAGDAPAAGGGTATSTSATSEDAASAATPTTTIEGTATTPTDGADLEGTGTGPTYDVGAVAADYPTAPEVRQCLIGKGVGVRDKANTKGDGVEIAHPGDLMTSISFESNEGIAKAVEVASKKYGKTLRVGTIVAALAPKGEPALEEIRACITP